MLDMTKLLLALVLSTQLFAQNSSQNLDRYVYIDAQACAVYDELFGDLGPPCQQRVEVFASYPINGATDLRVTLRYLDQYGTEWNETAYSPVNETPGLQTMVVFYGILNATIQDVEIEDMVPSGHRHGLRDQPVSPESGQ